MSGPAATAYYRELGRVARIVVAKGRYLAPARAGAAVGESCRQFWVTHNAYSIIGVHGAVASGRRPLHHGFPADSLTRSLSQLR
jgi:hypothetical protein